MKRKYQILEHREIDIEDIIPNDFNPNVLADAKFNKLVDDIKQHGVVGSIVVMKHPTIDGKYMIIDGEHRWRAAQLAGIKKVWCDVVEADLTEAQRRTVFFNVVKGKLDPVKFTALWERLSKQSGLTRDELKEWLGITSESELKQVLMEVKKSLPDELKQAFEKSEKKLRSWEDLSLVVNRLFSEYGSTVDRSFIMFMYGGKMHLMVEMGKELKEEVDKIVEESNVSKRDINEVFVEKLRGGRDGNRDSGKDR